MTSSRWFRALLVAVILIVALALRIGYIESTPYRAINDAGTYNRLASMIARTGDYDTGSGPGSGAGGSRGPTAYFPPGFPYFLAAIDVLDGHQAGHRPAVPGERVAMAVLGTATVGLVGLVGLEALGGLVAVIAMLVAAVYPVLIAATVGLVGLVGLEALGGLVAVIAMLVAAVYPVLIEQSGTLVAENLVVVLILAALWAGLRACRAGAAGATGATGAAGAAGPAGAAGATGAAGRAHAWIAGAGVLTGLATLTHQNAALILIPLAFAAAGAARRVSRHSSRRASVGAVALLVACAAAPIVPWTTRNAVELHAFVPISTETGITVVGTYNHEAAAYAPVPYKWIFYIRLPEDQALFHHAGHYTEPALSNRLVSQTLSYIGNHPLSPLDVGWHNLQRMLELEGTAAWHDSALAIGLSVSTAHTGVIAFWILCCLALVGVFTAAARRGPGWLWVVPLLMALSVLLVNVETPRFREPVEPFLVLLVACALTTVLQRLGLRRSPTCGN